MDFNYYAQIVILGMLAIAFIQSGLDKLIDRKGNLEYFNSVFKNVPVMNQFPTMLLLTITLMEVISGVTAIIGISYLILYGETLFALLAGIVSSATFLALFFGQRMAKDYAGAQVIVVYLIPTAFLLYSLG